LGIFLGEKLDKMWEHAVAMTWGMMPQGSGTWACPPPPPLWAQPPLIPITEGGYLVYTHGIPRWRLCADEDRGMHALHWGFGFLDFPDSAHRTVLPTRPDGNRWGWT